MTQGVLVVYTKPLSPDQEDAFNTWYDDTHVPDVLRVEGIVAATRYRVAAAQPPGTELPVQRYMAVYELDTDDLQSVVDDMLRSAPDRHISSAFDRASADAVVWEQITPRVDLETVAFHPA